MNADYGEAFCLGAFTSFEPLASCMSSPSAQGGAPNILDLGEAPPRLHHGAHLRATSVAAHMAFVLGVSRPFSANSNSGQGHTITATGIASDPQDLTGALQAHHAPYVSSPQRPPPSRTSFAMTVPHLPMAPQRTSESSSAASGSESPFPFQILSGSTLVPPGDEHTDALLQSLMNVTGKPAVQRSQGAPRSSNFASGPPDSRLATLGSAPAPPVEIVFNQQAPSPSLAPSGAGAADGSLGQATGSYFRGDDGHLSRSYSDAAASAAAVAAAATSTPYGTAHVGQPAATSSMVAAAIAPRPLPDGQLALLLDHNLMLIQQSSLPRAGAQAVFALGVIPPEPPLATHGMPPAIHEAAFGARQHTAPAPEPPQTALHTRTGALAAAAVLKQQQQQRAHTSVGQHASRERAQRGRPTQPPLQQQQQQQQQQQRQAVDELMCDAWVTGPPSAVGTPSAAVGAAAMCADSGPWRAGLPAGEAADGSRSQAANPSGDVSGSERLRRLGAVGQAGEKEVSSLMVAEKEACNSSIGVNAGPGSEGARARSEPAGSLARFSSGDVGVMATNQGETGLARVRSSSVGHEGPGDVDDRPATQGEDDTSSEDEDGSAHLHLTRKRTASQRRRGSAAAKKELCRERNRTAQRRFRERQKDLIKALQEQVEKQESLIAALQSRLAVYEDVAPPSVQLPPADVDIADTDEGLPKLSSR